MVSYQGLDCSHWKYYLLYKSQILKTCLCCHYKKLGQSAPPNPMMTRAPLDWPTNSWMSRSSTDCMCYCGSPGRWRCPHSSLKTSRCSLCLSICHEINNKTCWPIQSVYIQHHDVIEVRRSYVYYSRGPSLD